MSSKTKAGTIFQADGTNVSRQVVLPFRKSFEISVKSLRVRFFRSLITVASLVLAVAFLSFILIGGDMATGMLQSGQPELRSALLKAGYDVNPMPVDNPAAPPETVGASAKERWIVILSLLVCTVGIVNAQLMAVTERFREIGTMKCLGALDSFVLRLFLLEAGMQGLAGSIIGALTGILIGVLAGLLRFGFDAVVWLPVRDMGFSFLIAVVVGVALSVLGVVYPAIVAARMRPIEAMRTQE